MFLNKPVVLESPVEHITLFKLQQKYEGMKISCTTRDMLRADRGHLYRLQVWNGALTKYQEIMLQYLDRMYMMCLSEIK